MHVFSVGEEGLVAGAYPGGALGTSAPWVTKGELKKEEKRKERKREEKRREIKEKREKR